MARVKDNKKKAEDQTSMETEARRTQQVRRVPMDEEVQEERESNHQSAIKKKKTKDKKKKEKVSVTIETISENPNKISPIIGYFPSGYDPLKDASRTVHEGSSSSSPQPSVKVYRNVKRSNRMQLVVSPNGSKMDFVGTNYSGEAVAPQLCTYALGVLEKVNQTLKVVPIAANKIFRLEPRVGDSELQENERSEITKEELTSETKADKLRDLTFMYSTKKTIRQAKKRDSLRQKEDPLAQEDMNKKLEGIKINKEALEASDTIANARNIPPHDISATTPQSAYPLEKIIFKGEWDYLLDILELSHAGVELASDVYPSFVYNRAYKLDHIKNEAEKKRLGCIFSYITHLIKFKDKHSIDGVSSTKYHKFPSILSQKFSTMFANLDAKRLSDEKRDLLISYVLVLTLFADNFRSDPTDIAKDLRMNAIALRPHLEHLGCKLVREENMLLATLPVPLQFQGIRRKRRR